MTEIILYQLEHCPFCAKVRAVLHELKMKYQMVNVPQDREDSLRKELFQRSGVPTVPVICIDGKYIGDSAKIIDYLGQNWAIAPTQKTD